MRKNLIITLIIGLFGASIQCIAYKEAELKEIQQNYEAQVEEYKSKNEALEKQLIDIEEKMQSEVEKLSKEIDEKNKEIDELISLNDKGKEVKVELTGYCNCYYCTQSGAGVTAMGTNTRVGVIAVPQEIPLGSTLYIPDLTHYKSDGMFDAEDRGGEIVTKPDGTMVIDVWFPTHEQALEFGRVEAIAYIKE